MATGTISKKGCIVTLPRQIILLEWQDHSSRKAATAVNQAIALDEPLHGCMLYNRQNAEETAKYKAVFRRRVHFL